MKKVFQTAAAAVVGLSALTIAASSVLAADADSAKLAGPQVRRSSMLKG